MIRKNGYRFSEKILRKQEAKAKQRLNLKSFRFSRSEPLSAESAIGRTLPHDQMAAICGTWQMPVRFYLHWGRGSAMWPALAAAGEVAMARIHDESWWEPGETSLSVGRTLYWLATIIAAVMVMFAVADFFVGWAQGAPIVRIVALGAAVIVWLIGRFCRALLS
jgi:hypothetical protein